MLLPLSKILTQIASTVSEHKNTLGGCPRRMPSDQLYTVIPLSSTPASVPDQPWRFLDNYGSLQSHKKQILSGQAGYNSSVIATNLEAVVSFPRGRACSWKSERKKVQLRFERQIDPILHVIICSCNACDHMHMHINNIQIHAMHLIERKWSGNSLTCLTGFYGPV